METSGGVALMIMYEDESVEVRYRNGTQLQLSPCGCEFMLVRHKEPDRHPLLLPPERVRQRTRFTISKYRELIIAGLTFRNKFANRPYLPGELIPADHKKPFFSLESEVTWPEGSSYEAELGPGGDRIVRSEEGRALLALLPSGEEFFVEFTSSLSQNQSMQSLIRGPDSSPDVWQQATSPNCDNKVVRPGRESSRMEPTQGRSCSPRVDGDAQQKPEQKYQSCLVVQHHSCSAAPPTWRYPLSLARHHWTSSPTKHKHTAAEETSRSTQADERIKMSDTSHEERRSQLPQALPLTCSSPHWHRWKFKDTLTEEEESDLPSGLVKILWCQGVTYRILSDAVPVIEISPGDGSVIRSNGVLSSYFTHHKPKLQAEEGKVLTYHLNRLPPDVPGQPYSVNSIVSRASRILSCYNQAKQSLSLTATPSCIQEDKDFFKPTMSEQDPPNALLIQQHMNMPLAADNLSDLVAAELQKIKRFNFLLENNNLLRIQSEHKNLEESSSEMIHEPVNEDCVAEALQRTNKTIQDIDDLISAAMLT